MLKITKIAKIDNFGIFENFDWDSNLSYQNRNRTEIYDFKDINIIYGRNYSGKTSLSKIIRSLEKKITPAKYDNPNFKIELSDGSVISQNNLPTFTHPIHVYNSDFVKENLRFIHDENADIESFSVTLGGDNQQTLERIQELNNELGTNKENSKTGIFLEIHNKENEVKNAKNDYDTKNRDLEKLLADKATRNSDSIKNQYSIFGEINYTITKLRQDIALVQETSFHVLTDEEIKENKAIIDQKELENPPEISSYTLNFPSLLHSTTEILKTIVGGSKKIVELVNNSNLNTWVQKGHELHTDRTACAFCNNEISDHRREELKNHFDQETQNLQNRISKGIEHLISLLDGDNFKISFDINHYYRQYHTNLLRIQGDLQKALENQKSSINQLKSLLEQKNKKLFTELEAEYPLDYSAEIKIILESISQIRNECIQLNSELISKQNESKKNLRLNHIYHFLIDINYTQLKTDIDIALMKIGPLEQDLNTFNTRKNIINAEIKNEEDKLKSEGEACKRINAILQHDFGHQHLRLAPIEINSISAKFFNFEIHRNGIKAHNLSEGEQSLISFCYYLVKVQEDLEQNKKPILWLDDPICSLDSNHIFFIYSLINENICRLKQFSQLFISTHNLDFLKYLKRLDTSFHNNGATPSLKTAKFLVQRNDTYSIISKMPIYLSEYATEFNYLFKQIHTCASTNIQTDENHNYFYNFSNNARKFIEIYSFYKFPTYFKEDDDRLKNFWSNEIHRLFIGRINNEYSHCSGVLERGMSLIDIPEMQKSAKAIIHRIQTDINQYDAFLDSIDINKIDDPLHPDNQT